MSCSTIKSFQLLARGLTFGEDLLGFARCFSTVDDSRMRLAGNLSASQRQSKRLANHLNQTLKESLEVLKCQFLGVNSLKSIQAVFLGPGIIRLFLTHEPFLSRTFGADLRRRIVRYSNSVGNMPNIEDKSHQTSYGLFALQLPREDFSW